MGEAVSTVNYTYDSYWKDKLTAYGDTQITTDAMGNPLNYTGKNIFVEEINGTLEWNGRQLSAAVVNATRYEFSYNTDGLRTSVKELASDGTVRNMYYYIWENGKLTGFIIDDKLGDGDATLKMLYDSTGDSIGYEIINQGDDVVRTMHFQKNMQGDITGVFDDSERHLISYTYDAWGNVTLDVVATGNSGTLAALAAAIYTPITYRGYMYDYFTGLYYLQSRYYNPTYGRFLNADTTEILEATQGTPLGANLFAYCNNNPVNMVDYGGTLGLVATIALVIIIIVIFDYIINNDDLYTKSFLTTIRDFKISKMLNKYTVLSGLFDFGSSFSNILDIYDEHAEIFLLYYAHSKNIVDYGTGVNNAPYYPEYAEVCGDGTVYKERCGAAYTMAIDLGLINRGVLWQELTCEQQYVFVKGMMFYDYVMWRDLTFFSTKKMGNWGTEELAGFYFGFMDILNK